MNVYAELENKIKNTETISEKIKLILNCQEELSKIWNSDPENEPSQPEDFDNVATDYFSELDKSLDNFDFWETGRYDSPGYDAVYYALAYIDESGLLQTGTYTIERH